MWKPRLPITFTDSVALHFLSQCWSFQSYFVISMVVTPSPADTRTGNLSVIFDFSISSPFQNLIWHQVQLILHPKYFLYHLLLPQSKSCHLRYKGGTTWAQESDLILEPGTGTHKLYELEQLTSLSLIFLTQKMVLVLVSTLWGCLED